MADAVTRRAWMAAMAAGAAGLAAQPLTARTSKFRPADGNFRNGLCASAFAGPLLERNIAFSDGRRQARTWAELQRLMMAHGSTEVFARLGSSRAARGPGREGAMVAAKRMAQLARSVDLPLNPELLLCAHYGDMGGQPEPDFSDYPEIKLSAPWHELGIEEMCDAMRLYGRIAAREIMDTGVKVNVWDIGNEVEFGVAGVAIPPMVPGIGGPGWSYRAPDAVDPEIGKMSIGRFYMMKRAEQVAWGEAHLWNHVGKIMAAVADGIRQVDSAARFATHTSAIGSLMPEVFTGFHASMVEAGFHADHLGVSYYPTNTKLIPRRLDLFKETVELAVRELGRPVYIAEFGYAAGPVTYGGQDWANPVEPYSCTPQGQAAFLQHLVEWGAGNNLLSGIRPWAPDFVGGGWQGMALFEAPVDGVAVARPGLRSIEKALAIVRRKRK